METLGRRRICGVWSGSPLVGNYHFRSLQTKMGYSLILISSTITYTYEPQLEKINRMLCTSAKTQVTLYIRQIWTESMDSQDESFSRRITDQITVCVCKSRRLTKARICISKAHFFLRKRTRLYDKSTHLLFLQKVEFPIGEYVNVFTSTHHYRKRYPFLLDRY